MPILGENTKKIITVLINYIIPRKHKIEKKINDKKWTTRNPIKTETTRPCDHKTFKNEFDRSFFMTTGLFLTV